MNKKIITVSVLAVLLAPATQGFAQKLITQAPKKLNPAKLERMVTQGVDRLVPRVPGVYIPAGTTVYSLERKVAAVAKKANIKLDEKDVRVIAYNPVRLRQFQEQAGMPIFEGRPLPVKEGLKVLKANQEKFAQARAEGKYETAWQAFMQKKAAQNPNNFIFNGQDKGYSDPREFAADIANFYKFNDIDLTTLPRVRMEGLNDVEGVVLEIPVDGLSFIAPRPLETSTELSSGNFVVILSDEGKSHIITRHLLGAGEDGQVNGYRVIK